MLQAWRKAPADRPCKYTVYIHVHAKHSQRTHLELMLFCLHAPLDLRISSVSERPKAFKCFKLIITLMLSLPLWPLCLSVRKLNAIEIDSKTGGCSDFLAVAGDLPSLRALRREQRVNRKCYTVGVGKWRCPANAAYCTRSSSCTLACCFGCFYFWEHGCCRNRSTATMHGRNGDVQTKNSPQPPSCCH